MFRSSLLQRAKRNSPSTIVALRNSNSMFSFFFAGKNPVLISLPVVSGYNLQDLRLKDVYQAVVWMSAHSSALICLHATIGDQSQYMNLNQTMYNCLKWRKNTSLRKCRCLFD